MSTNNDKTANTEPNERRDNGGVTATGQGRGGLNAVEARPGHRKVSGSGIYRRKSIAKNAVALTAGGVRPMVEQGVNQDAGDSSGGNTGSSNFAGTAPRDKPKVSRETKKKVLKVLDAVVAIGVIVLVILTLLVLGKINQNINSNHNDTTNTVKQLKDDSALNESIIICMLQVPLAQRTTDLANQCRVSAQQAVDAANQTSSQPSTTTTTDNTGTTTTTNAGTASDVPSTTTTTPAPVITPEPTPVTTPAPSPPGLVSRIINDIKGLF